MEGKAVKLGEVAKVLGQSEGQASKMVKSLGRGGWLIVTRGEKDGREAQVAPTEAGREIFAQCKLRIRSLVKWPLWGEQAEWPKDILAALRNLNYLIACSRMALPLDDPEHDKKGWPLAKEGDDWPRRRKPLGQHRLSGAAAVEVKVRNSRSDLPPEEL